MKTFFNFVLETMKGMNDFTMFEKMWRLLLICFVVAVITCLVVFLICFVSFVKETFSRLFKRDTWEERSFLQDFSDCVEQMKFEHNFEPENESIWIKLFWFVVEKVKKLISRIVALIRKIRGIEE